MDNVQESHYFNNKPSSQTFRFNMNRIFLSFLSAKFPITSSIAYFSFLRKKRLQLYMQHCLYVNCWGKLSNKLITRPSSKKVMKCLHCRYPNKECKTKRFFCHPKRPDVISESISHISQDANGVVGIPVSQHGCLVSTSMWEAYRQCAVPPLLFEDWWWCLWSCFRVWYRYCLLRRWGQCLSSLRYVTPL
jgi:hypothetical protein